MDQCREELEQLLRARQFDPLHADVEALMAWHRRHPPTPPTRAQLDDLFETHAGKYPSGLAWREGIINALLALWTPSTRWCDHCQRDPFGAWHDSTGRLVFPHERFCSSCGMARPPGETRDA